MISVGDHPRSNENKTIDQQGFRQISGLPYFLYTSVV